ncbi:PREDICTED: O-acyltransferase WSD1-like [Camelina sativa]|uniref:O-acyltransferase WSD1-like n=1 Tax=Camelina sativa TaxID=90675 RepID=A0ABM0TLC0_CAMSA|nr:PREDICTED: O-acyltransferase WSD1-like [Camelina sativa]
MAIERQVTEGEEPVSPFARLFSLPGHGVFNIVTIGCKTEGNPSTIVEGLKNTLINHPRFSSILVTGHGEYKGKAKWIPTKVKVEDHVIVPDIDPNIENPDEYLENYTSRMALSPMDMSKPLWEFHLLKLKTSHAEYVFLARFHHSLGDGMSLMSLLLACARKIYDPEALPTFVAPKKSKAKNVCFALVAWLWFIVRVMFHTCVEVIKSMVFICCARGASAHIIAKPGATLSTNKFIHQIIKLDDVKMVKNAMNMTVNDVLFGMVQAGLFQYLNQRFDLQTSSKSRKILDKQCLHGVVFFNLRPNRDIEDLANMMAKGSKCRWGNSIGYVLIPLEMKSSANVFEYVRQSKTIMDRKKHSFEPLFSHGLLKLTMEVFGFKALTILLKRIFGSTTMIFSNVVGPTEEISLFGHQICYIGASSYGIPQELIINVQSYVDKLIINIGVDVEVIPDPHHLCDLIIEALHKMKSAAPQKIFHASEV